MSIPDGPQIKTAIGLEPVDAIDFLRSKGALITGNWTEWRNGQHATGFTVANVTKLDVLTDIQDSLVKALQQGQTLEQWKESLIPLLREKGWWRREGTAAQLAAAGRINPATGEIAKGLTPHRLKVIYETNMQSAYMAGRQKQMLEQVGSRPYWSWVSLQYGKHRRPSHVAMHGRVFRYDDELFTHVWPPCGFGCKCTMRSYSERDMQRSNLKVESTKGKLKHVDVPLRDGSTAKVIRYTDPSFGKAGYFQPDVGFSQNLARSVWTPRLGDRPRALSAAFVRQTVNGPAFERFVSAKGGLKGTFPVAVLNAAKAGADAGVYLDAETLANGVANEVPIDRLRLLPDLVEVGERVGDDVYRLWEPDGMLEAKLAMRDGLLHIVNLIWSAGAAP